MFIVSKALLISSVIMVRAWGAIWLNPSSTVLFNVCSITVKCWVLYPCCVGVLGMFAVM